MDDQQNTQQQYIPPQQGTQQQYIPPQQGAQQQYIPPKQPNVQQQYIPPQQPFDSQQQNIQNQYTQQQYIPPQQQYRQPQPTFPAGEGNSGATIMCVISLLLQFVVPTVTLTILSVWSDILTTGEGDDAFSAISSSIIGLSYLASWVLMIVARVKYPDSKFAKVVMWIYIVMLALGVLLVIFLIVSCMQCLSECPQLIIQPLLSLL